MKDILKSIFLFSLLLSTTIGFTFDEVAFFEPILVEDHIIVNFDYGTNDFTIDIFDGIAQMGISSLDDIARQFGVHHIQKQFPGAERPIDPTETDLSGYYIVYFDSTKGTVDDIRSAYEKNPYVGHTENDHIVQMCITPNDPELYRQWAITKIECEDGWDYEHGDNTPVVAICDSGVDWQHPDLNDNIWDNTDESVNGSDSDGNGYVDDVRGWDFVAYSSSPAGGEDGDTEDNNPMDWNGHGTHCAGIASAETNNGTGIAGTGWGARIMALRIGWEATDGRAYTYMNFVASAFYYAADNGADIINLSYGSSNSGGIAAATNYAINTKDCLICVSAGNSGTTVSGYLQNRSDVMCVAASTQSDQRPNWSSYGNAVDVTAPGQNIYSTIRVHGGSHTYDWMSGTSMSSPMVCGEAALIRAHWPGWNHTQVFNRIIDYVDEMPNEPLWVQGKMGSGRINVYKALSGDDPLQLAYFTAESIGDRVIMEWDVDWMEDILGFDIYRVETPVDNAESDVKFFIEENNERTKINETLIMGEPPFRYVDDTVSNGSYIYTLVAVENDTTDEVGSASVDVSGLPTSFAISSVYPNPISATASIVISLAESTDVKLEVYDITGRVVETLTSGNLAGGEHTLEMDCASLTNGLYIVRMTTSDDSVVDSEKFVVVH